AKWDDYAYAGMLNALTYRCGPMDYSGNAGATLYSSSPLTLYGPRSSTLEQFGEFEYGRGPWDQERNCYQVLLMLQDQPGRLLFVNNGQHRWLSLTLGYAPQAADSS